MKLAIMMGRTLAELRQTISSDELTMWAAYQSVHGFPSDRHEAGLAIAGAAQIQTWGGKCSASDLLPQWERPQPLTWEQAREHLKAWARRSQQGKNGI